MTQNAKNRKPPTLSINATATIPTSSFLPKRRSKRLHFSENVLEMIPLRIQKSSILSEKAAHRTGRRIMNQSQNAHKVADTASNAMPMIMIVQGFIGIMPFWIYNKR